MLNRYRNCTNLSDSLAKAIERVCKEKDKEKKRKGEINENGNRKENRTT